MKLPSDCWKNVREKAGNSLANRRRRRSQKHLVAQKLQDEVLQLNPEVLEPRMMLSSTTSSPSVSNLDATFGNLPGPVAALANNFFVDGSWLAESDLAFPSEQVIDDDGGEPIQNIFQFSSTPWDENQWEFFTVTEDVDDEDGSFSDFQIIQLDGEDSLVLLRDVDIETDYVSTGSGGNPMFGGMGDQGSIDRTTEVTFSATVVSNQTAGMIETFGSPDQFINSNDLMFELNLVHDFEYDTTTSGELVNFTIDVDWTASLTLDWESDIVASHDINNPNDPTENFPLLQVNSQTDISATASQTHSWDYMGQRPMGPIDANVEWSRSGSGFGSYNYNSQNVWVASMSESDAATGNSVDFNKSIFDDVQLIGSFDYDYNGDGAGSGDNHNFQTDTSNYTFNASGEEALTDNTEILTNLHIVETVDTGSTTEVAEVSINSVDQPSIQAFSQFETTLTTSKSADGSFLETLDDEVNVNFDTSGSSYNGTIEIFASEEGPSHASDTRLVTSYDITEATQGSTSIETLLQLEGAFEGDEGILTGTITTTDTIASSQVIDDSMINLVANSISIESASGLSLGWAGMRAGVIDGNGNEGWGLDEDESLVITHLQSTDNALTTGNSSGTSTSTLAFLADETMTLENVSNSTANVNVVGTSEGTSLLYSLTGDYGADNGSIFEARDNFSSDYQGNDYIVMSADLLSTILPLDDELEEDSSGDGSDDGNGGDGGDGNGGDGGDDDGTNGEDDILVAGSYLMPPENILTEGESSISIISSFASDDSAEGFVDAKSASNEDSLKHTHSRITYNTESNSSSNSIDNTGSTFSLNDEGLQKIEVQKVSEGSTQTNVPVDNSEIYSHQTDHKGAPALTRYDRSYTSMMPWVGSGNAGLEWDGDVTTTLNAVEHSTDSGNSYQKYDVSVAGSIEEDANASSVSTLQNGAITIQDHTVILGDVVAVGQNDFDDMTKDKMLTITSNNVTGNNSASTQWTTDHVWSEDGYSVNNNGFVNASSSSSMTLDSQLVEQWTIDRPELGIAATELWDIENQTMLSSQGSYTAIAEDFKYTFADSDTPESTEGGTLTGNQVFDNYGTEVRVTGKLTEVQDNQRAMTSQTDYLYESHFTQELPDVYSTADREDTFQMQVDSAAATRMTTTTEGNNDGLSITAQFELTGPNQTTWQQSRQGFDDLDTVQLDTHDNVIYSGRYSEYETEEEGTIKHSLDGDGIMSSTRHADGSVSASGDIVIKTEIDAIFEVTHAYGLSVWGINYSGEPADVSESGLTAYSVEAGIAANNSTNGNGDGELFFDEMRVGEMVSRDVIEVLDYEIVQGVQATVVDTDGDGIDDEVAAEEITPVEMMEFTRLDTKTTRWYGHDQQDSYDTGEITNTTFDPEITGSLAQDYSGETVGTYLPPTLGGSADFEDNSIVNQDSQKRQQTGGYQDEYQEEGDTNAMVAKIPDHIRRKAIEATTGPLEQLFEKYPEQMKEFVAAYGLDGLTDLTRAIQHGYTIEFKDLGLFAGRADVNQHKKIITIDTDANWIPGVGSNTAKQAKWLRETLKVRLQNYDDIRSDPKKRLKQSDEYWIGDPKGKTDRIGILQPGDIATWYGVSQHEGMFRAFAMIQEFQDHVEREVATSAVTAAAGPALPVILINGMRVVRVVVNGRNVYRIAPKDVALGLRTIDGAESLGPFGARLGASTSDDWARLGLHNAPEGRFDIAFQQTLDNITGNGGRIKFNLDSLNVKNALGGNPLERIDRYTEWELQQIVRKKGWFNATDFYLNGQKLSLEQLLELGIKLH